MSKKKKQKGQITLTRSKVKALKSEITEEALQKTMLLFLLAARDEFGLGETRIVRLIERVDRYADHVDNHLVSLKEVQEIFEKNTGMKMKGF